MADLEKMKSEMVEIESDMDELASDSFVKRYIELENRYNKLIDLYRQAKEDEYLSCDHIWVKTFTTTHYSRNKCYGCVKCGFDGRVIFPMNADSLEGDYKIMSDVLERNPEVIDGWDTAGDIKCDFDLAKAIYAKVREKAKEKAERLGVSSDELAKRYMKFALYCMRNKDLSERRMEGRAERLGLPVGFHEWGSSAVYSINNAVLK